MDRFCLIFELVLKKILVFLLQITEFLDVSMELGCFLAGALLSSQGHMVTAEVTGVIEPIRDFLAIIFFASIGQMERICQMFVLFDCSLC